MTLNHRLVVTKLTNYRKIYRRTAVAPAHPHGRAAPTPPQSAGPIAAGEAAASGHSGQPRTEEVQARLQHSPRRRSRCSDARAGTPVHRREAPCIQPTAVPTAEKPSFERNRLFHLRRTRLELARNPAGHLVAFPGNLAPFARRDE